jgi:hypothetical protein
MSKQITLIQATVAALLLAVGAAHAAPQEIVKLPRVVVTGKAVTVAVLPRVVVVGKATVEMAKVNVLPRVVVTGLSLNTQMQRQMLASAQAAVPAL